MSGFVVFLALILLYPVRFVWPFGHDWVLSHLLGWGMHRTELELHQLYIEQREKANRHSGKQVRRMNKRIKAKRTLLKSLTSLQLRLGVVGRPSKGMRHVTKVA